MRLRCICAIGELTTFKYSNSLNRWRIIVPIDLKVKLSNVKDFRAPPFPYKFLKYTAPKYVFQMSKFTAYKAEMYVYLLFIDIQILFSILIK